VGQKRYTAKQIIGKLRQAEVVSICRLREPPNNSPNSAADIRFLCSNNPGFQKRLNETKFSGRERSPLGQT